MVDCFYITPTSAIDRLIVLAIIKGLGPATGEIHTLDMNTAVALAVIAAIVVIAGVYVLRREK